jgi:hypothetical protein
MVIECLWCLFIIFTDDIRHVVLCFLFIHFLLANFEKVDLNTCNVCTQYKQNTVDINHLDYQMYEAKFQYSDFPSLLAELS